ncbi:PIN-like domain-containing protein [Abiotrophia sp.]|uniref:PIN-like domain-containing protein n=1 Tax=Abiotrophia sp. TaxID=76631 RepID=UPI0027B8B999|nr:PIN-like domain-containing protein [Abiotrophia sp.]
MKNYINGLTEKNIDASANTIYILDTNYLLDALTSVNHSKKYFEAIINKDIHIFIPFIVWVEFNYNVQKVLDHTNNSVKKIQAYLKSGDIKKIEYAKERVEGEIYNSFNHSIISDNSVGKTISEDSKKILDEIINKNDKLNQLLEKLNKEKENIYKEWSKRLQEDIGKKIESHLTNVKELLEKLQANICDPKSKICIGEKYNEERLERFVTECQHREGKKLYPGNSEEDLLKDGIRIWDNLEIPRKYGDMLFWLELMEFAKVKSEFHKFVIVSNDTNKNDWIHNKTNQLFSQLSIEFYTKTHASVDHIKSIEFVNKLFPETTPEDLKKDYLVQSEEESDPIECALPVNPEKNEYKKITDNYLCSDIDDERHLFTDIDTILIRYKTGMLQSSGDSNIIKFPIEKDRASHLRYVAFFKNKVRYSGSENYDLYICRIIEIDFTDSLIICEKPRLLASRLKLPMLRIDFMVRFPIYTNALRLKLIKSYDDLLLYGRDF